MLENLQKHIMSSLYLLFSQKRYTEKVFGLIILLSAWLFIYFLMYVTVSVSYFYI